MVGLVIVGDFHLAGIKSIPPETHPILVVYPDAVLPGPVAFERLEAVARWQAQFVKTGGSFELGELS